MVIYTRFLYVLYFQVTWKYRHETTPGLKSKYKSSNWTFLYHGYIYRISVCFVFPRTVKVSIRNCTCNTRPSVHLEIDHFLSWLYIPDFRIFCISMYSEGINTKLHLDYKGKCTSWNWSFFYHGYIYRISVYFVVPCTVQWRYQYETTPGLKSKYRSSNWSFFIMVIYTRFPYVLYFHVQWRYQYETTPALYDQV